MDRLRKPRAFGEDATLFLREESFVQRKEPHRVEATLSLNISSIIFLKLRVAIGMYTLLNPFNSRELCVISSFTLNLKKMAHIRCCRLYVLRSTVWGGLAPMKSTVGQFFKVLK